MIVTQTPFVRTESLKPLFFYHSTCIHCGYDIFVKAYGETYEQGWSHTDNESVYCGDIHDWDSHNFTKALPAFGPNNLEMYWVND